MFNADEAREMLLKSHIFYPSDEDGERQTLNMNDTWGWATAWGEKVTDEELPRVAELFFRYGWCGLVYWVSEKHHSMESEFHDVNRHVEFVRQEEKIRVELPDSYKRAYTKKEYTLGK